MDKHTFGPIRSRWVKCSVTLFFIQNMHIVPLSTSDTHTSSTLPLWTVTVWSTLQSSKHQNDQTQEQFLPSSNPSHEHLTLNVEHTTLLYNYLFITHTYFFISVLHISDLYTHNCLYYILCFCYFVHCLFVYLYIILYYLCPVLLHCGASVTITNFSYV